MIVRGANEERAVGLGVVSKGAMKEFPPSMNKSAIGITAPQSSSFSPHGLIGINRPQNDSTLAGRRVSVIKRFSHLNWFFYCVDVFCMFS